MKIRKTLTVQNALLSLFLLGIFSCSVSETSRNFEDKNTQHKKMDGLGKEPIDPLLNDLEQVGRKKVQNDLGIDFADGLWGQSVGTLFSNEVRLKYLFSKNGKSEEWKKTLDGRKILVAMDTFYPLGGLEGDYYGSKRHLQKIEEKLEAWGLDYEHVILSPLPLASDLYLNRSLDVKTWDEKLRKRSRDPMAAVFQFGMLEQSPEVLDGIKQVNEKIQFYTVTNPEKFRVVDFRSTFQNLVADGQIRGNDGIDYPLSALFSKGRGLSDLGQEFFLNRLILPELEALSQELRSTLKTDNKKALFPLALPRFPASLGHLTDRWVDELIVSSFIGNLDFKARMPGDYLLELESKDFLLNSGRYLGRSDDLTGIFVDSEASLMSAAKDSLNRKLPGKRVFFPARLTDEGLPKLDMGKLSDADNFSLVFRDENEDKHHFAFLDLHEKPQSFHHLITVTLNQNSSSSYKFKWTMIPRAAGKQSDYLRSFDFNSENKLKEDFYRGLLSLDAAVERIEFDGLLQIAPVR